MDEQGTVKEAKTFQCEALPGIQSTWEAPINKLLLLFTKFEPSADHVESISADKIFLRGHTKWIFLLGVCTVNMGSLLSLHFSSKNLPPHFFQWQ